MSNSSIPSIANTDLLRNIQKLQAAGWQKVTITPHAKTQPWQIMWRNSEKTACYILPEAIKQLQAKGK